MEPFLLNDILDETFIKIKEVLKSFENYIKIDQKYKSKSNKINQHKHAWLIPSSKHIGKTKMFIDLQNDVTAKDIK